MKKVALQLDVKEARELYKSGSPEIKKILESSMEEGFFSQNVVDRINDWKDMLDETGRPDVPQFSDVPEDLRPFFQSVYQNVVMVEAYNEGTKIDIYDKTKPRYYPYFETNGSPSAFAFDGSLCDHADADAGSGSRFALKDRDLAIKVGKKHTGICRNMLEL